MFRQWGYTLKNPRSDIKNQLFDLFPLLLCLFVCLVILIYSDSLGHQLHNRYSPKCFKSLYLTTQCPERERTSLTEKISRKSLPHKIRPTDLLCRGLDASCSGHGVYQHESCSCVCNPGWEGPDCSVSSCPDECNDNGRCVDGRCVCHQGYTGDDCGQVACPGNCSDKGHCVDGRCVCFSHFTGDDCSTQKCPNDCVGHGRCVDGRCVCDEGLYGEDCSSGKLLTFFPERRPPSPV